MKTLAVLAFFLLCVSASNNIHADVADNPAVPVIEILHSGVDLQTQTTLVRVALVDSGVNYQLESINTRLARDATGELIGYDFWDLDAFPFDSHPVGNGAIQRHGTRTASILLREAPYVQLVPYRYPRPDMQRMTALVEHADKHGVKIIGLPLGGNKREPWLAFEQAALAHPHILFVASAGNNGRNIDTQPIYPASLDIPNMLVVTSADDYARLAPGVNWGRTSVDYMVPAEHVQALHFDGEYRAVSGSSYAVPRVVALAARYLRDDPTLDAMGVIQRMRSQFANGLEPKRLGQGFLYDPQYDELAPITIKTSERMFSGERKTPDSDSASTSNVETRGDSETYALLAMQVLVVDAAWTKGQVLNTLHKARTILSQCEVELHDVQVDYLDVPSYLRDLETGATRTLMQKARASGADKKLTVVLGRDTLMREAFEAEAFGRGNTRYRPWLTDSVWVTLQSSPAGVVLAHELVHVLTNSGSHSRAPNSLMNASVSAENTFLSVQECDLVRQRAGTLGLLSN